MDISIDRLIEQSGAPVSLPEVFLQINRLTQNPDSSVADIARIVETDVGLTARLLQLVNSPYYGFPSSINSIPRAITIIGMEDLRDLALTTTTIDIFINMSQKQDHIRRHWQHSLYCAVISKLLAELLGQQNTERFFVSGLLHDLGRLVLFQGIPETVHHIMLQAEHSNESMSAIEKSIMGYTHTDVGARLAQKWNLPVNIIESITFHHAPEKAQQYPLETLIVHVADRIAHAIENKQDISSLSEKWNRSLLVNYAISEDIIRQAINLSPSRYHDIYELLFPADQAA